MRIFKQAGERAAHHSRLATNIHRNSILNMRNRSIPKLSLVFLVLSAPALAQSLKDKAGFGGNLSALEASAILAAEIRFCEANNPEFKTTASSLVARLHSDPRYREFERSPEFAKLAPEADALVRERSRGIAVASICGGVVQRLK